MKLPPIPTHIHTLLGPVPVTMVPNLKDDAGVRCFGLADPAKRTISLHPEPSLLVQWHTLEHEGVHFALWDSGVTTLAERDVEHICDAIATARVAAMLATTGTTRKKAK